jgi:hypothetical protein
MSAFKYLNEYVEDVLGSGREAIAAAKQLIRQIANGPANDVAHLTVEAIAKRRVSANPSTLGPPTRKKTGWAHPSPRRWLTTPRPPSPPTVKATLMTRGKTAIAFRRAPSPR